MPRRLEQVGKSVEEQVAELGRQVGRLEREARSWWGRRTLPQKIVLSYLIVGALGALAFSLPVCWRGETPGLVDAFFLSMSAVCVTGLATVDYASHLAPAGRGVLLVLIETGGLGTMTLATLFLSLAQRRSTLRLVMTLGESFHQGIGGHVRWLGAKVTAFALTVQGLGALLLHLHWRGLDPGADVLFESVFTSASAFCNAGFALDPSSFAPLRGDWISNLIVIGLVVAGGLGYLVHFELGTHSIKTFGRKKVYLSLQSRLTLAATAVLLVAGALMFLAFEQGRTLAGLPVGEQVTAAFFQSAMTRTAGFSSVDWGAAREATCFFALFLMLIGAGSGSTGGGVKVTSAAILWGVVRSRLRGDQEVVLRRRVVPAATVLRAIHVVILFVLTFAGITGAILLLESFLGGGERLSVIRISFESMSALCTVGLSMGITASLSAPSQLVLCLAMLIGRVGPLTVSLALVEQEERAGFSYPEEDVMIG